MGWIWRFIDWCGRFQLISGVVQHLWAILPIGWFVGTGVAGYMTGQPIMWIMVAVPASAAFICASIIFSMFIKVWLDAENKIRFIASNVGFDFKTQRSPNSAKRIDKAQVMMQVSNDAHFPISMILESARSSLEEETPPRGVFPRSASTIGSRGVMFVVDDPMDMKGRNCGNLAGSADFRIKYGYPGKEKYVLNLKGNLSVSMDSNGSIRGIWFNHSN